MTWTYSGDPKNNSKDEVRFYLGDTDPDDPQLQDEELEFLLDQENDNALGAASRGASALAALYAREMNKTVGSLSIQAEKRMSHYQDLAAELQQQRREQEPVGSGPYLGSSERGERFLFHIGMHDRQDDWAEEDDLPED